MERWWVYGLEICLEFGIWEDDGFMVRDRIR